MKVVALVPFWEKYESNSFRVKKLAGRYLLSYTLEKLSKVSGLDDVIVYSSNEETVSKYIEPEISYTFMSRPESLDDVSVTIEHIIGKFLEASDADVIMLIHPTSPLLKVSSIQKCLNYVVSHEYDSSFSAVEYKKFAWCDGRPVNYDLQSDIPKIDEIKPLHIEQSSLFVFKRSSFLVNKHRVAGKIKVSEIEQIEGLEVRSEEDFELLELIINSGMYEEKMS